MNQSGTLFVETAIASRCGECPLQGSVRVPPSGNPEVARVVLVGEAPGQTEAREGVPFCGRSGKYLRENLKKVGFDCHEVYILNAVQCHPRDEKGSNRTPSAKEIECCREWLLQEIRKVRNRKLVILCGAVAIRAVLRKNGIHKLHGVEEWDEDLNCLVLPTYHPAAILRDTRLADAFINDLRRAYTLFTSSTIEPVRYTYPETVAELQTALVGLGEVVAFDLETTGLSPFREGARVLLVSLSDSVQTVVVPVSYRHSSLPVEEVVEQLRAFFASPRRFVAHNGKFDTLWLKHLLGIDVSFDFDTKLAQYLLNEVADTSLKRMASAYTTVRYDKHVVEQVENLEDLPQEDALQYSANDAFVTCVIAQKLEPELKRQGLSNTLKMVLAFARTLRDVELNGILLDQEALHCIRRTLEEYQQDILRRMRTMRVVQKWEETTGKEFNPQSGPQLREILYGILNLPVLAYTDKTKQPSTDLETIKVLGKHHELPQALYLHSKVRKLISTYVDDIQRNVMPDGRIHSFFHLSKTVTGRLSSSEPNLQNIPSREAIGFMKRVFVPQGNWLFLNCDYSQIELRVLASLSGDPVLCDAYQRGADIHTFTAQRIFGREEVSKEERHYAKAVNFGLVYGMSAVGLSKRLGISEKEAGGFMQEYFRQYPKVSEYIERVQREVLQNGYVRSPFGRYRRFHQDLEIIKSGVLDEGERNSLVGSVLRKAVNFTIQSTASDITQLALYRISLAFQKLALRARVVLTVHDSILVESPPEEVETVLLLMTRIMANMNLPFITVPLVAEAEVGRNYYDMVPYGENWNFLVDTEFTSIEELPEVVREGMRHLAEECLEEES